MDKLLWVTAPLAVALVALGWAAWRGRLPSRTVLNVAFSVLLLAYVLGTAGLGIFWVANQQLPMSTGTTCSATSPWHCWSCTCASTSVWSGTSCAEP